MTQVWRLTPQFKIEISGETYTNDQDFTIIVNRPENNISSAVLSVNDYKSEKYIDVFDALDALDISLRYGSGSWTKVHSGIVSTVQPLLTIKGEVLGVSAWGDGNPLIKTCCNESYGVESRRNQTLDTPKEVIEDLIDNHINQIFGAAAASNWSIGKKVEDAHNGLSITYLDCPYTTNFVNINRVCDITNAYAGGLSQVSVHWYVDTTPNLYFKKIDADHSDGNWDRYWGGTEGTDPGTQASSTIVVKKDMLIYDFRKNVEEYANHIVLSSKWRMPSEDYWTENQSGLWDVSNCTLADNATCIVGSKSLRATPDDNAVSHFYYPSAQNAGWDLTKVGSERTPSTLSFYIQQSKDQMAYDVRLYTDVNNYFNPYGGLGMVDGHVDEWVLVTLPIGPYHQKFIDDYKQEWQKSGAGASPSWSNINWLQINMTGLNFGEFLYLDDLHFSGVVVREAKDISEITANKTYMLALRNDTAVSDTLVAATNTGTAARLAYAELLRRSQTPVVGKIRIPLAVDLLPGQTVHIHAGEQSDGTYRINADFRVKEVTHFIGESAMFEGFETQLNLTSDVTNTHAFGAPDQYSLLMEYAGALGHSEARDLKGSEMDNLIPRLTNNY